ncbi:MAG: pyrimidine reductase family protein [Sciscionella sp.]
MHRLWPVSEPSDHLDQEALEALYAFPEPGSGCWVAVNFVSSADGAVTRDGRSDGLSGAADKQIFSLGRDLADVVLVGAGTALIEGYRGAKVSEPRAERRQRHGLAAVPPIAVVTRSCSVRPDAPLITAARVPTIVLTCEAAPPIRRKELAAAGAQVIVAGERDVDLHRAIGALAEQGLRRICCEGGPKLFGSLLAAGLVDELRLTVAPLLTSGDAGRICDGPWLPSPTGLELASVLQDEGSLMLRYLARP